MPGATVKSGSHTLLPKTGHDCPLTSGHLQTVILERPWLGSTLTALEVHSHPRAHAAHESHTTS